MGKERKRGGRDGEGEEERGEGEGWGKERKRGGEGWGKERKEGNEGSFNILNKQGFAKSKNKIKITTIIIIVSINDVCATW